MKPIIAWPGGKYRLAKATVSHFPKHKAYVEPFVGSMSIFLAKQQTYPEFINDAHNELTNMIWVLKTQPDALQQKIKNTVPSEKLYELLNNLNPATMGDVSRAFRFIYLIRNAFGHRYGDKFGLYSNMKPVYDAEKLIRQVRYLHIRLRHTTILCRDYRDSVPDSLNKPDTLVYCDPPYFGSKPEAGYGGVVRLKEFVPWIRSLNTKIIVAHDFHPKVHKIFRRWHRIEIGDRQNSLARNNKAKRRKEYIYCNFEPEINRRSFL